MCVDVYCILQANPTTVQLQNGRTNETIDYNERFSWNNLGFVQGRLGFGPNGKYLFQFQSTVSHYPGLQSTKPNRYEEVTWKVFYM